ncbi:MAG: histone deacetylase family protein [Nanopusillaceae archaeon]
MLILYSRYLRYHNSKSHIENNKRVKIIEKVIRKNYEKIGKVRKDIFRYIHLAHTWKYIREIKRVWKYSYKNNKILYIDEDTYISPLSFFSILKSIEGVLESIERNEKYIFIPTRPPGHHSGKNGIVNFTRGFCIFNNVAVGAIYARKKYKNVLILDIDIHHGNGTQEIIENKRNIYYISTHAKNIYPFSGLESGNNYFNFPLNPGISDNEYINLFKEKIIPLIENINPEIIFVSLGFDMHKEDPLSVFNITLKSYEFVFDYLKKHNKVIFVLEGGYNIKVIFNGIKILLKNYG